MNHRTTPLSRQPNCIEVLETRIAPAFAAVVDLTTPNGLDGFELRGEIAEGGSGFAVNAAGDINGDGFDDLIIGAPGLNPNGTTRGDSYVVFGKAGGFAASLDLSTLDGSDGFKIYASVERDSLGMSVSSAGDVNGDGFGDLLIGAPGAGPNSSFSGASYVIFGQPNVQIDFSAGGKTVAFLDVDGDRIQVKVSKGSLSLDNMVFNGGVFLKLYLSGDAEEFAGGNITVAVKKGATGDGRFDLGAIDALGIDLGTVKLPGDLGQIDAGDTNFKTAAIKPLSLGSLGAIDGTQTVGTVTPFQSDLVGALGKLTVKGDVKGAINVTGGLGANIGKVTIGGNLDGSAGGTLAGLLRAGGNIAAVTIKGSVIGGADFSGIIAGGKLGKVSITGDLTSVSGEQPVFISALGDVTATKAAKAVAIAGVTVRGDVLNARILAGYNASLGAANTDASIGAVTVLGDWSASSIVAGVADTTGDGFGRNDERIGGGLDTLIATIAKITIKGTASGSAAEGDHFGITAEYIAKLKVGSAAKPLDRTANNLLLDESNGDFGAVDFA